MTYSNSWYISGKECVCRYKFLIIKKIKLKLLYNNLEQK